MLIAIIIVVVCLSPLAYAYLIERHWFALRRHVVACLPPNSAPIRVLHVSDLHYRVSLRTMRSFVLGLQSEQPDLIVGTGDFLGEQGSDAATECARILGSIKAKLGAVYVLGSNDYFAPIAKSPHLYFRKKRKLHLEGPRNEWEQMVSGLGAYGWELILNRSIELYGIEILGLDDPHIYRHDLRVASERKDDRFRLAVVHSPDGAPPLAELGYDLILAGHTHGGQVRVPIYGALVTNTQTLPRKMARGLHRLNGAWLHVSAGMGTSKYAPIRFFCRPEACILELVPRVSR
ncbi:MAG: metallophosphoesterase [Actinomycetota bacterium]